MTSLHFPSLFLTADLVHLLSEDALSAPKAAWKNTTTQNRIWLLSVFLALSSSWFSFLNTVPVLFLILTTTLQDWNYSFYIINEETEAERDCGLPSHCQLLGMPKWKHKAPAFMDFIVHGEADIYHYRYRHQLIITKFCEKCCNRCVNTL